MDQATANLIARVNSVTVSVDDLLVVSDEIHKLPPDARVSIPGTVYSILDIQLGFPS